MRNRLQQLIYAASMTTIFVGYPFFARAACPDGYVQVGETAGGDGGCDIIIHPVCQAVAAPKPAPKPAPAHPVPDLAKDPDAARMGAAQLKIDNDRITMLKKEIALLSDDNPEWAKERDIAMDDLRDDGIGITEEGFNLMVLGLDKLVNGQAKEAVTKAFTEASAKATTGIMAATLQRRSDGTRAGKDHEQSRGAQGNRSISCRRRPASRCRHNASPGRRFSHDCAKRSRPATTSWI